MKQTTLHLLFFLFFIVFLLSATSQSNKAEELIQQSIQYTLSLSDFEATFNYQHLSLSRKQVESKGKIRFKNRKYVIYTEDSHIYFNNQSYWVYFPKYNQYMNYDNNPSQTKSVFSHMNSAFTETGTREYQGLENTKGIQAHKISIRPTSKTADFKHAYLWLHTKTLFPIKAVFINKNGSEIIYQFTNFRPNQGISDAEFDFQHARYPGSQKIEDND
ncbi:MAG: outer membrane lipoprotein carrier protein LolA [Bacteroidetes bacterium]|nr:outer membrane lipoprotein carrier protein LolA [Bacteroidota bacterium]